MNKGKLLEIKLHLLIKKGRLIPRYNLSGTAWKDYYSSSEVDRMYKKAERNENRFEDNERKISETIKTLMDLSYPLDNIISKYPEISHLIPNEEKTSNIKK